MAPPLAVIIATCRRSPLLHRTLTSLAAGQLPPALQRIVVVENGPRLNAEGVVAGLRDRLPLVYQHVPDASKSLALNRALAACRDEFVVFFDDDVRVGERTLRAYAAAVSGRERGLFIGGRCHVDYEQEPPEWLLPYLPLSAKGWSLGPAPRPLAVPHALGFNWGAFARDIQVAGGFDPAHGPGRAVPIGEETRLQEALLHGGVKGVYLPEAEVWHYVPRERCSPEWALRRSELMGFCAGERLATLPARRRRLRLGLCAARMAAYTLVLQLFGARLAPRTHFHFRQRRAWRQGYHRGLRHASRRARELLAATPVSSADTAPRSVVRGGDVRAATPS